MYIILLSINLAYILSYLKIPFKTLNSDKIPRINKMKNNNIYINISFGFPNQNQNKILISQEKDPFYIYINHSYFFENSITSKNISNEDFELTDNLCKKGTFMTDIINLKGNNYENISFVLCTKYHEIESLYFDGRLGLSLEYDDKNDINLIRQLKSKNIINNYCFSFVYENDNEGFLLIGEFPHNLNLNENKLSTFKEEYLNWIPAVKNENKNKWSITFDKISYSNSELFQIQRNCILSIENRFITAPNQYFDLVKDIFGKKCKHYQSNNNFHYLLCDKDIDKEFIPQIFFFNKQLNLTFNLDYNDLFYEEENSLIFLVTTYHDYDQSFWILGKPFFKKYLLLFNMDSKMVGFYKKEISENFETNKKNVNSFNTSIFINILLFIIIIILSFSLYHCYVNKRRIRANELEDKFNYIAKNDEKEIR